MSKSALIARKAKIQKQIDENTSDYWWNMCGSALQADIELIDAILEDEKQTRDAEAREAQTVRDLHCPADGEEE